ncbi:hypothetical protein [Ideonella sp. A 288]|uniref:hypothetical protein n=1 Tax=Ideonella sp. A 288 TaxID=1962181 RepID=UPI0013036860|nr:hypothetical protein [Ideonella sp. A 288]
MLTAIGELLRDADGRAWCQATVTDADGRVVSRAPGSFRDLPLPKHPEGDSR